MAVTFFALASAQGVTVNKSQSAAIRMQPPWCFTNYNGAVEVTSPALLGSPIGGMDMIQFDLSAYTNKLVDGDAQLLWCAWWADGSFPVSFGVFELLSNWNQAAVTWANYIGDTNGYGFTNVLGQLNLIQTIPGAVWPGSLNTFVISNSLIQKWLNDPASNHGLALVPMTPAGAWSANGNVLWYMSGATWRPENKGQLMFSLLTTNIAPNTPVNLTPSNGAFGQLLTPTLMASAFVDPDANGHTTSWWQVSAFPDFSATVWDTSETSADLTSLIIPTGVLNYSTRYYWRVKYKDAGDKWSAWSAATYFDTVLNLMAPVVVGEGQSCMIMPGPNANSNFNPRVTAIYNPVNPATNIAPAGAIMYWFDLRVFSQYTGMVVSADGDLSIYISWTAEGFPPTYDAYAVLAPWQETNATWNNFIGSTWSAWADKFGTVLDTELLNVSFERYHWTIPMAVMQEWINMPGTNFGIALIPQGTGNSEFENRNAPFKPTLTFDLVNAGAPTPSMPTNVAPANGAHVDLAAVSLSASAYHDPSATPQAASQWQIALDNGMQDVIWDSGASTAALASVSVPAGVLTNTTRYYWHVRYINQQAGKSSYSAATYFDTPIVGGVIVQRAAQAAMIMYTDPTQNWNSTANGTFNMLNPSNGVAGGPIMLWFDLGVFQGQGGILASNPAVSVQLSWVEQIVALNFELHEILAPWTENSVTWAGFVGPDPATLTNLLLGPSLAVQQLPVEVGSTCIWAFSETVIQDMLDGVTTNYGFALVPAGGGNAQVFSRQNPARAPYLTVEIVPEPLAGVAVILCAAGWLRRRT